MHALVRLAGVLGLWVAGTALATGAADAQRAASMVRQEISVPAHPNAVCNDGSKPIIYYQSGSGADRNKWVIYLQGGGGCATDAACAARARDNHELTSSVDVNLPASATPEGIISSLPSVNPDFAAYNHVFLHYCSSDAYAGDTERKIGPATWQFRGTEIVAAMLDQLSAPKDAAEPSLKDAAEVLVAGESAGAMGVANNLDRIADQLAAAKVKGIADSGWVPYGIKPYAPGSFDIRPDSVAAFAYHNAQPDQSCAAAHPDNPGACLNQHFAFPYITTPMFVFADQRDRALLAVVGVLSAPQNVPEREYVYEYGRQVRDSLAATAPAYFIADSGRHTVLLLREFSTIAAGGTTLGSVLHNWYFGTPGPLVAIPPPPGPPGSTR
jgi:hypothetical protein